MLAYLINKRDLLAPSVLCSMIYVICVMFTVLNQKSWGIEYSDKAFCVMIIMLLSFVLPSVFFNIKNTNVPILLEGNMPIEENECVVEKNVLTKLNKAIGDTIQLETEEKSKIKEKNLKIVGIVQSPLYISRDRGTTTLSSGKIYFYVYVKPENINQDVYPRNLYKNKLNI